jgi:hypothetical protein
MAFSPCGQCTHLPATSLVEIPDTVDDRVCRKRL